jgi:hypothetical protein
VSIPGSLRLFNGNNTTPPNANFNSISQILFFENQLAVSVKGTFSLGPGFVGTWAIASNFSLSENFEKSFGFQAPPGGFAGQLFGMVQVPGRNALVVADGFLGMLVPVISRCHHPREIIQALRFSITRMDPQPVSPSSMLQTTRQSVGLNTVTFSTIFFSWMPSAGFLHNSASPHLFKVTLSP